MEKSGGGGGGGGGGRGYSDGGGFVKLRSFGALRFLSETCSKKCVGKAKCSTFLRKGKNHFCI